MNTTGAAAPWDLVGTGDFNGDGTTDFAWHNKASDEIGIWMFDSTDPSQQLFGSRVIGKPVGWDLVAVGDFDGNGTSDLAFRHRESGSNAVWKMDGYEFTPVLLPPVPDLNWELRGIADFDGNGSPELMWRRKDNGVNSVWVMGGDANTTIARTYDLQTVDTGWKIAALTDVDSDGKTDIIWRQPSSAQTAVWTMNGATLVTGALLAPSVPVSGDWKLVGARIVGGRSLGSICSLMDDSERGVGSCLRTCTGGRLTGWGGPILQSDGRLNGSCDCACDDSGASTAADPGKIAIAKPNAGTACTRQAKALNATTNAACRWIDRESPKGLCGADDAAALGCNRTEARMDLPLQYAQVGTAFTYGPDKGMSVTRVGACTPGGSCDGTVKVAIAPALVPVAACAVDPACVAFVIATVGAAAWLAAKTVNETGGAVAKAIRDFERSHRPGCEPCPDPPPDFLRGPDTDHLHHPCPGAHTHVYRYKYNQDKNCKCWINSYQVDVICQ